MKPPVPEVRNSLMEHLSIDTFKSPQCGDRKPIPKNVSIKPLQGVWSLGQIRKHSVWGAATWPENTKTAPLPHLSLTQINLVTLSDPFD